MLNEAQNRLSSPTTNPPTIHGDNEAIYSKGPSQSNSIVTHTEAGSINGIPGAAFNATPVYDAHGGLVGLQTPMDQYTPSNTVGDNELRSTGKGSVNYMSQQTNMNQYPNRCDYIDAMNYQTYMSHPITGQPSHYQQLPMYHSKITGHDYYQRPLMMEQNAVRSIDSKQPAYIRGSPQHSFDTCPTICSIFAIFCCPITLCCSLPALVYSVCAYTDYRSADPVRSQRKSDIARHLVIVACVVGLLLCIAWTLLAIFYHEVIFHTITNICHTLKSRV